jgi:hypothetical protein
MCNIFDMPREWAESDKKSEAEAFEQALKRIKPEDKLVQENADLRHQLRRLTEENRRLREALFRQSQDNYEYE